MSQNPGYNVATLRAVLYGGKLTLPLSHTRSLQVIAALEGAPDWFALKDRHDKTLLKARAKMLREETNTRLLVQSGHAVTTTVHEKVWAQGLRALISAAPTPIFVGEQRDQTVARPRLNAPHQGYTLEDPPEYRLGVGREVTGEDRANRENVGNSPENVEAVLKLIEHVFQVDGQPIPADHRAFLCESVIMVLTKCPRPLFSHIPAALHKIAETKPEWKALAEMYDNHLRTQWLTINPFIGTHIDPAQTHVHVQPHEFGGQLSDKELTEILLETLGTKSA